MKIHKALKIKNRLAGEMSRLMELIKRENSRRNDNLSEVDVGKEYEKLLKTREDLIAIKTKISQANVSIYHLIFRLSELKTFINFVQSLPTRRGEEKVFTGGEQILTYEWKAYLTREEIDKVVVNCQEEINLVQDQIDEFNSKTEV